MVKIVDNRAKNEEFRERYNVVANIATKIWESCRISPSEVQRLSSLNEDMIYIHDNGDSELAERRVRVDVRFRQIRVHHERYFEDSIKFAERCEEITREEWTLMKEY